MRCLPGSLSFSIFPRKHTHTHYHQRCCQRVLIKKNKMEGKKEKKKVQLQNENCQMKLKLTKCARSCWLEKSCCCCCNRNWSQLMIENCDTMWMVIIEIHTHTHTRTQQLLSYFQKCRQLCSSCRCGCCLIRQRSWKSCARLHKRI